MASNAETQRLFFALWPPDPLRNAIQKNYRRAVQHSGGKPVPASNFHMTLAFLGSLDAAGALTARRAADSVHAASFDLRLDRLGFWSEAGVLWLGTAQPCAAAGKLATQLAQALRAQGLEPDAKPFVAHLSLARKVNKPGELHTAHALDWHVDGFSLLRSHTQGRSSEYRLLASWPLQSRAAGSGEL
ncbi:MAG: RNA 2',3'-cyclic phosphodiesterase [Gammaproteobacteria bacterium]|nr:RNA 2',3'-cyclic phosphodiesterase [Gammaproteobacteria bacterium]